MWGKLKSLAHPIIQAERRGEREIMKLEKTAVILVLMLTLISTNFIWTQVASQEPVPPIVPLPSGPFEKFGPRIDRLVFKVAGSVSTEAYMLDNGDIDLMDWAAPGDRWDAWLADPEITMGDYSELSILYFAPNHARWPLGHGDMLPHGKSWSDFGGAAAYRGNHRLDYWPTVLQGNEPAGGTAETYFVDYDTPCQRCLDARQFRRGLSHLMNRAAMVAGIKGIIPLETLIMPAIWAKWRNDSVLGMYPYDLDLAGQELELGGFKDYDGDGWLEYHPDVAVRDAWSPGDPKPAGTEELPSLQFYIRQDDPDRIYAATLFYQDMALKGVPNTPLITTNLECSEHAWQTYDYDLYTEYWDWGTTLPDLYYEAFHSRKDEYPRTFTDNADRYHSKEFDAVADAFLTATTDPAAVDACKQMQWILVRDAVVLPTYDYGGYMAHRTKYGTWPGEDAYQGMVWDGIDNQLGLGFVGPDMWTYYNAHPEGYVRGLDGKCTLRQGMVNDVSTFNIATTWWYYDLQVLEQIYEGLLLSDPLNGSRYVPWLCDDYTIGTWEHPTAGTCTAVNVTLIPGILWQDATTENPWTLTAEDVGFTYEYYRDTMAPGYYTNVKDFDSYVIHPSVWSDKHNEWQEVVELRFSIQSWLIESYLGTVIIPKHIWEGKDPAWDPATEDAVIGTGPFMFFKDNVPGRVDRVVGQYVYLQRNPTYFRKFVRPEFWPEPDGDGEIDTNDFNTAVWQAGYGDPNWYDPVYGPLADVNKDGYCDSEDITEIAVRMGQTGYVQGYPLHYAWPGPDGILGTEDDVISLE